MPARGIYGRGDRGNRAQARPAALSEDCAFEGETVTEGKGGATVQILLPVTQRGQPRLDSYHENLSALKSAVAAIPAL